MRYGRSWALETARLLVEELGLNSKPATRAVESRGEMEAARLLVMVPKIHDLTTQSMRTQSGKFGAGVSLRT